MLKQFLLFSQPHTLNKQMDYQFKDIEQKWQKFWADNKTFRAENTTSKPKYYVLDMFPTHRVRACMLATRWVISPLIFLHVTNV
jgi:hypothetical protein